ncbi:MAG TPA: Coenzyme F420 hydrogenase/dehydrogenase, beta subunit C-terminal domain [Candidatus Acidoferrales bacterium]|nr:Coenzyme F420 hydrogenase/dehydrogenase, beta subunit C-terminal domain [Candidatus Acidoferrales bacterium]
MTSQVEKVQAYRAQDQEKLERQFLTGTKDEDLGIYCDLFSAKSEIVGQDGGVVTSLLVNGFREGLFDVAVVVRRMQGYNAEAVIVENETDVLAAKGTSYLKINVTKTLRELISQGKKHIAIVCTPCEAKAARKIQQTIGKDYAITVIGLFCFEAFNPAKLKEEAKKRFGIDIGKADKTQVRHGKFTAFVEGREVSCKVNDLSGTSEAACRFCDDFTSTLADVSVGSVGSPDGYSTVVVRSPTGARLVKAAGLVKSSVERKEIAKLVKFKRERAKKSFTKLKTP